MIDAILEAVVERLEGLALTWDSAAIPVAAGKHPRQGEGEGATTQITVHADQRPKAKRRFTNQHDLHTFTFRIAFWSPGNRDNTDNMEELSAIEDAVARCFERKPLLSFGLTGLRDVRSSTESYVPRPDWLKNWDVVGWKIEVDLVRERVAAT